MKDVIGSIVRENVELFGSRPEVKKINVGFTNTIFIINDKYVVKICTNSSNEEKFAREIEFYMNNKDNDLIPKLYYASMDKSVVPYYYEVIERIDGVSLYNVWHTLNEVQMEDIIKQLCMAMKMFHSNTSDWYDWTLRTKNIFVPLYEKARGLNLFSEEETNLIDEAYKKFDQYLESKEMVLVHNDLHFDNVFYSNGKIKLIDFERAIYAPLDFELDILYRMVRMPWKFASEETEGYVELDDYKNIMKYIEKYYPELVHIDNLEKRLAIYEMIYFMKQYIGYSHIVELKDNVLKAARIVVGISN